MKIHKYGDVYIYEYVLISEYVLIKKAHKQTMFGKYETIFANISRY